MRSIQEIRSLTGLRGIAALYVIVFHYFPLTSDASPLKRIVGHGYLAVDLFFVLSGFVMALNYRHLFEAGPSRAGYRKFLGRRIARIYPLYLVATLVGFVCIRAGWLTYEHTMPTGLAGVCNVLMVQAWGLTPSFDSPAWSISAEWAAYLLFPVLLIPTLLCKPRTAWVCAGLSIGVLALVCAFPRSLLPDYLAHNPLNMNGYWMALPVLRCVPEFTLGILAFRLAGTQLGRRMASSPWVSPLVCLLGIAILAFPECDLAFVLVIPVLITSLSTDAHAPGRILGSRPAQLIGTLSFSIYLTHKLFFGLLTWLYTRGAALGLHHARSLSAAMCFGLTLLLAYGAYHFIEVPGRRLLRDWFSRGTPAPIFRGTGNRAPNEA